MRSVPPVCVCIRVCMYVCMYIVFGKHLLLFVHLTLKITQFEYWVIVLNFIW